MNFKIKNGDVVEYSNKNKYWYDGTISAYAGFKGKVEGLKDDGSFFINSGGATLVISGYAPYGKRDKGVSLIKDGIELLHEFVYNEKPNYNPKKWFQFFIPKSFTQ